MTSKEAVRSALAVLLLGVCWLAGCAKPGGVTCSTGIYCAAGWQCAASQPVCIQGLCGNGVVDPGEACDDGGVTDGDSIGAKRCSADCRSDESCGNGVWDKAVGEACDKNDPDLQGACSDDCKSNLACGNGKVDPGEDCDGGPTDTANVALETPLCNSNCTASRCGDGIRNGQAGEACDGGDDTPGSTGQSATCNVNCSLSECGDAFVNPAADEECDRGPGGNSDTGDCLAVNCHLNVCGDGFPNETLVAGRRKEECDAGSGNSDTGACLTTCRAATCGDGKVQAGVEACDSGADSATVKTECLYGQRDCTRCSQCQWVDLHGPYCGDGLPAPGNEACDDGDRNGATTCLYNARTCSICNSTCTASASHVGPYCGDGIQQAELGEACDDGNNDPEPDGTRCPYDQTSCVLCSPDCHVAKPGRAGSFCGDSTIDAAYEECDSVDSFACGTCGLPGAPGACTVISSMAAATGSLTVVSNGLLGVTFELNDDQREAAVTFEFVNGNEPQPGNVAVSIAGATAGSTAEAGVIATSVETAIGRSGLTIDATVAKGSTVVQLRNRVVGVIGNASIVTEPPDTAALTATGMRGGVGCVMWQRCSLLSDCVPLPSTERAVRCGSISHVCRND